MTTPQLYDALAKAAAEFQPIAKNRTVKIATKAGGSYLFRYADLDAIIAATRPALSKHGLAVVQPLVQVDAGTLLVTQLVHAEGGVLESTLRLPPMQGDPKEYGALITYSRRYAYTSLLCVSADDDLDQDGGGGKGGALASDRLAFHLAAIMDAPNIGALRAAYAAASEEGNASGDADALKRFAKARDDKAAKASSKKGVEDAPH